jgi:hypothetical protein
MLDGVLKNSRGGALIKHSGCRRICSIQSTQDPLRSTSAGRYSLNISIKSSYSLLISTGFDKPFDLLWDKWSHLHNSHKLNGLQNGRRWDLAGFVVFKTTALEIPLGTPLEFTQIHFRACFGIAPKTLHGSDPGT